MKKQLVYDFPTRAFHWLFASLFLSAFAIAKLLDSDSQYYSYHMMAGLTLSFAVSLRVFWGFVGTRHARFQNFVLKPKFLMEYFKGIVRNEKVRWSGHNPASSWAALLMMFFGLGLGTTGFMMASGGDKEVLEEIHEVLANSFFIVACAHVLGIALHTLRFKDLIGLSMVTGKKENVPDEEAISLPRTGLGIIFVSLVFAFSIHLLKNFDTETKRLKIFGFPIQLGETAKNDNHGEDD